MKTRFALVLPLSLALSPVTALAGGPAGVKVGASASTDATPDASAEPAVAPTAAPANTDPAQPASSAPQPASDPASTSAPAPKSKIGVSAAARAEAEPETIDEADYAPEGTTPKQWEKTLERRKRWVKRWLPVKNMVEVGVFGGVFIASPAHDFYDPASTPQVPLWSLSPDIGARVGYFPLPYLGVEVEGSVVPAKIRTPDNDAALLYGVRGHAILRAPWWRVSPFLLGGFGMMGISSDAALLGNDIDPVGHYGLGLEIFINRLLAFRLEGRHLLAARERELDNRTSHAQVLAGLSLTFGRKLPKVPPPAPEPPPPDRDGDGVFDFNDGCPDVPGIPELEGCPPPPDTDGDGFIDVEDKCPEEAGVADYQGCPIPDTDGDGFLDPDDDCPKRPETKNGFEDKDGCPDELPPEVEEFDGVIEGIFFETNSDKTRRKSRVVLDKAIELLKKFPEVKLQVTGHTDDRGSREHNLDLSKRRAQSVVDYLVAGGIDASRLRSRGAGPDEPRVENDTRANRALNRRTEFHVLNDAELAKIDAGETVAPAPEPEPQDSPTDAPTDAP